ncbi:MAG: R2-like ligand-binding oxidase [Bacteroidota bacterium]
MRTTFATTRRGLDHASPPMRLWRKAKKLGTWDPAAVDLSQDREDWQGLGEREQDLLLRLTAQFAGGEESVTADLLPLLGWAARTGRVEDEMFLTSYLWEEAKHVEAFDRVLREVAGVDGDLEAYLTDAYRGHFMHAQPEAMDRLRSDDSPEALADAVATYQMTTEGVLAETGYHAYYTVLGERGILPGTREMVGLIQRDESRHVGYGIHLLSELIAEHGDPIWAIVEARMSMLLMGAMQVVGEMLAPYGDDIPFGITVEQFMMHAQGQFQKRYARLEKARTQTVADVRAEASGALADEPVGGDGAPAA